MSFFFELFHVMKRLRYNRNSRMELHHRLRKAREAKGLGVQEVADVLKVKRVQVWRMEKDASFISIARLNELAKLYGVEASSLLDDTVEPNPTSCLYRSSKWRWRQLKGLHRIWCHLQLPAARGLQRSRWFG